ncbi:MAG: ABC transporter substrate-binding protein [Methanomicrobiales archaeon]|nr:ABC transporter substrate-binding protein [Methanomicrobiales archaeon]
MEIKNPWIIIIALLVVIACGAIVVLAELHNVAAEAPLPALSARNGVVEAGLPAANGSAPVPGQLLVRNATHRIITDMAGRVVTIPANISLVLCTSPPPTTFVYMLAPEKLGSVASKPTVALTPVKTDNLSAVQENITISGPGQVNYEAYIAMHPDLVFISCESGIADPSSADLAQEKFGAIPVVCVDNARNATMYGPTLLFMGDVLGVPDVAARQNKYYQSVLAEVQQKVATIPKDKRVRVYYAEGANGLSTDPGGSCHSQLIEVCGGINAAGSNSSFSTDVVGVTKEYVLMHKPAVILSSSKEFIAQAYNDSTWQLTPAVRNHRVYLIPIKPNNWFDRPPGVNRIVGIPWTAHVLYPDLFTEDWFNAKAKEFYSLFYHVDLSDKDLADILAQNAMDEIVTQGTGP